MSATTFNGGPDEVWKPHCKMSYLYRDIWKKKHFKHPIRSLYSYFAFYILYFRILCDQYPWSIIASFSHTIKSISNTNQKPVFIFGILFLYFHILRDQCRWSIIASFLHAIRCQYLRLNAQSYISILNLLEIIIS